MLQSQFGVYLGRGCEDTYVGFIAEEDFFMVLIWPNSDQARTQHVIKTIRENVLNARVEHLVDFDSLINEQVASLELPSSVTLSAGLVFRDDLLLKTVGEGEVYLRRGHELAKIIHRDNCASGPVETNDLFIFTNRNFFELFPSFSVLSEMVSEELPHDIVERITPVLKSQDDQKAAAIFVRFQKSVSRMTTTLETEVEENPVEQTISHEKGKFLHNFKVRMAHLPIKQRNKKTTLAIVVVLVIILIWSVGLGVERRIASSHASQFASVKQTVAHAISQANDLSFTDPQKAKEMLSQARSSLQQAKVELRNTGYESQISDVEKTLDEAVNKISKKEVKTASEFFDLAIDNQKAKGDKLTRLGDSIGILDSQQSTIYVLSVDNKSLEKRKSDVIKECTLIALSESLVYCYIPSKGVFSIDNASKTVKVIDQDPQWGEIADIHVYGSNIYLLDSKSNDIYKYTPVENGFSEKLSYLKGYTLNMQQTHTLAIDGSIYFDLSDNIAKFTGGAKEDFSPSFPFDYQVSITKILTDKNMEKVYVWDKPNRSLYELDKTGAYVRALVSDDFNKAIDVVIDKKSAFILLLNKIVKIDL